MSRRPFGQGPQEAAMQEHIYRVIELVGSSETSIEHVENGKVAHYQVTLKVGFTMEAAA
jgi:dodecin